MNAVTPGAARIAAPHLNPRPTRELEVISAGSPRLAGRFEAVELVHARTGIVAERYAFDNLITNTGLDRIGAGERLSDLVAYCAVGSGTTAPTVDDASLQTELARTTATGGFGPVTATGPAYAFFENRVTRVLGTGEANGVIAEVGFFDTLGTYLWCRQLIRDANGQPTTISKTSEFQLRIVYAYRVYTSPDAVTGTMTVNGVSQTVTSRHVETSGFTWSFMPLEMGAYWGSANGFASVGQASGLPTSSQAGVPWTKVQNDSSRVAQAYTPGSMYRDVEYTWDADRGNFPINVIYFGGLGGGRGAGATGLSVPIEKSDTQKLVVLARFPWARVTL